jgi:hypothetical protein
MRRSHCLSLAWRARQRVTTASARALIRLSDSALKKFAEFGIGGHGWRAGWLRGRMVQGPWVVRRCRARPGRKKPWKMVWLPALGDGWRGRRLRYADAASALQGSGLAQVGQVVAGEVEGGFVHAS